MGLCSANTSGAHLWTHTHTHTLYLSISVHHRISSLLSMKTGKCSSFPCFTELERVVIVRNFSNCNYNPEPNISPPTHTHTRAYVNPTAMFHLHGDDMKGARIVTESTQTRHRRGPQPITASKRTRVHTESVTLATRPCSKHSCRSSLSLVMGDRGLPVTKTNKEENVFMICGIKPQQSARLTPGTFDSITWTCLEGSPRSSGRGAQQRPPWHQS